MSKRALVILLLAACKKPTQATRDAAPSTAVPIASASESAALDASRPETAAPVPEDTSHIDAIVTKWNAAHVAHDAAALRSLYGERVYFYGQMLAAADAAARKEAAFSKSKDYAQSVDAVSAKKRGDRWVVDFTKRAISAGRTTDYPSVLYVDARDRITLEMDKLDSQWCHANDQQIVPPFTINEAQAEAHMLRAHTIGGSVVVSGPDSRPFVQQLTCPDPTECASGESRTGPPSRDVDHDPTMACFFLVRLGVYHPQSQKITGGTGHDWFDLGSWVDGVTNVLWFQDVLGDASDVWQRDPRPRP